MPLQFRERSISYTEPFMFVAYGFYCWILTIFTALFTLDTRALLSLSTLADHAFARLWLKFSPIFALRDNETALPHLLTLCTGTILELGPGTGSQLPRYLPSQITKIYGVEPVLSLHHALRTSIKAARLDDVYEIVPCEIQNEEALRKVGIVEGSIDTILSVQVLCSVDANEVEAVVRALYGLLKRGGKLVVYEHVGSEDWGSAGVQKLYTLSRLWPLVMGNCHLDRSTQALLERAGPWAKNELRNDQASMRASLFPRVVGVLTK